MSFPTLPGAALSGKAAAGLAVAFLAVGGASAATISATATAAHNTSSSVSTTTSTNQPQNPPSGAFGQQVKAQVATCKSDLQTGQHGIGQCVSAWVFAHNPGSTHRNSSAQGPSGNAPTVGAPTNHPTGAPVSHPGR